MEHTMSYEYNDKGKIFTDVIRKTAFAAIIQTNLNRIEGFIHVKEGDRFKDELDYGGMFLAVTNAKVFDANGNIIIETKFISVARHQIIWAIPGEELKK
jgi:hypothetical protein